jgi:hypothetical protein
VRPGTENIEHVRRRLAIENSRRGRLLSEFLVGLALLFLVLGANLAILHRATKSSEEAALSARALELARDGMEEVIAKPGLAASKPLVSTFGAGKDEDFQEAFSRRISLKPFDSKNRQLMRATVTVEWDQGGRSIRLERYVRVD